jgi:hypothetical protein
MTDDELLDGFERATLPGDAFTHAAHVRVAWCYLRRYDTFAEALWRFSAALRRYAAAQGAADKYHETVTVAWMALIAERADGDRVETWPEFAARWPELFQREPSPLAAYYSAPRLQSDRARRVFVLPDPRAEGGSTGTNRPGP